MACPRFPAALAVCFFASFALPSGAEAQAAAPTFNKDVAPVIYERCASCHHQGAVAPFSLITFDDVKQRARLVAEVTERHFMPPWKPESAHGEFEGDRRLSDSQVEVFQRWAAGGFLEGDPRDLPPAPTFTDGWQLGTPDLVITMPEGFTAPADGGDVFHNFVLPVPVKGRRHVRALEFRPGNPRVVHHVRILLDESGDLRRMDAADRQPGFAGMDAPGAHFPDGHFLGWSPGKTPSRTNLPWPIEPGVDFVVQMHLKPSGRPEPIRASIGLYFADKPAVASPVMLRLGSKTIDIPAGAVDQVVSDAYVLPVDVTVLRIYPHAHYLARALSAVAELPDGSLRQLLKIADWDFNWQDEYEYARPVSLPRGTTIRMRYTYDNSAANPRNPSVPPRHVRFGAYATDEMAELLVQVLPNTTADLPRLRRDVAGKTLLMEIDGGEKRLRDAPDDYENRNALGVAYVKLGRTAEALAQFEAALAIAPDHAVSRYNLGIIEFGAGRIAEARAQFERALKARPDYAEAHTNLGVLLQRNGEVKAAIAHFRKAIDAKPGNAVAHNNLARALLGQGKHGEAARHLQEVATIAERTPETPSGQIAELYAAIADAYAADGELDRALRAARAGFVKADTAGDPALLRGLRERVELYYEQLTASDPGVLR